MGKRQSMLAALLDSVGMRPEPPPRVPSLAAMPSMSDEILDLYRRLGGRAQSPVLSPGGWDMSVGGVIIELDEEQHFNRYRGLTLTPGWAREMPWFDAYRTLCISEERACLQKAGHKGFWSNKSADAHFGLSAVPKQIDSPGGSSRWKQRALYDAMKDAAAYAADSDYPLARLSVHDTVNGVRLGSVLQGRANADPDALIALVRERLHTRVT